MFSVRVVTADYYMSSPLPGLDPCQSHFREAPVKKVPVVRVFGATPSGQKTCLHLHGIFPYLYVPYDGYGQQPEHYLRHLAFSIDRALNVALGNPSSSVQHVFKVLLVYGMPFYGYHEKERQFMKIYLYNPAMVKRVCELLQGGAIMNKIHQPHEAHIPYLLQLFIDYNLYGMNLINLAAVKFRKAKKKDDLSEEIGCGRNRSLGHSSTNTLFQWEDNQIPSSLILEGVEPQSTCELEVDAVAADILNRLDIEAQIGQNPGLQAIWEDEKQRRRENKESSQISAPESQDRGFVTSTESEKIFQKRLKEILKQSDLSLTLSGSVDYSNGSQEFSAELTLHSELQSPKVVACSPANMVEVHRDEEMNKVESSRKYKEDDALINEEAILNIIENSQHFQPLSQRLNKTPVFMDNSADQAMIHLLAGLEDDGYEIGHQISTLSQHFSPGSYRNPQNSDDEENEPQVEKEESELSLLMSQRWDSSANDVNAKIRSVGRSRNQSSTEDDGSSEDEMDWSGNSLLLANLSIPQLDGTADENSDNPLNNESSRTHTSVIATSKTSVKTSIFHKDAATLETPSSTKISFQCKHTSALPSLVLNSDDLEGLSQPNKMDIRPEFSVNSLTKESTYGMKFPTSFNNSLHSDNSHKESNKSEKLPVLGETVYEDISSVNRHLPSRKYTGIRKATKDASLHTNNQVAESILVKNSNFSDFDYSKNKAFSEANKKAACTSIDSLFPAPENCESVSCSEGNQSIIHAAEGGTDEDGLNNFKIRYEEFQEHKAEKANLNQQAAHYMFFPSVVLSNCLSQPQKLGPVTYKLQHGKKQSRLKISKKKQDLANQQSASFSDTASTKDSCYIQGNASNNIPEKDSLLPNDIIQVPHGAFENKMSMDTSNCIDCHFGDRARESEQSFGLCGNKYTLRAKRKINYETEDSESSFGVHNSKISLPHSVESDENLDESKKSRKRRKLSKKLPPVIIKYIIINRFRGRKNMLVKLGKIDSSEEQVILTEEKMNLYKKLAPLKDFWPKVPDSPATKYPIYPLTPKKSHKRKAKCKSTKKKIGTLQNTDNKNIKRTLYFRKRTHAFLSPPLPSYSAEAEDTDVNYNDVMSKLGFLSERSASPVNVSPPRCWSPTDPNAEEIMTNLEKETLVFKNVNAYTSKTVNLSLGKHNQLKAQVKKCKKQFARATVRSNKKSKRNLTNKLGNEAKKKPRGKQKQKIEKASKLMTVIEEKSNTPPTAEVKLVLKHHDLAENAHSLGNSQPLYMHKDIPPTSYTSGHLPSAQLPLTANAQGNPLIYFHSLLENEKAIGHQGSSLAQEDLHPAMGSGKEKAKINFQRSNSQSGIFRAKESTLMQNNIFDQSNHISQVALNAYSSKDIIPKKAEEITNSQSRLLSSVGKVNDNYISSDTMKTDQIHPGNFLNYKDNQQQIVYLPEATKQVDHVASFFKTSEESHGSFQLPKSFVAALRSPVRKLGWEQKQRGFILDMSHFNSEKNKNQKVLSEATISQTKADSQCKGKTLVTPSVFSEGHSGLAVLKELLQKRQQKAHMNNMHEQLSVKTQLNRDISYPLDQNKSIKRSRSVTSPRKPRTPRDKKSKEKTLKFVKDSAKQQNSKFGHITSVDSPVFYSDPGFESCYSLEDSLSPDHNYSFDINTIGQTGFCSLYSGSQFIPADQNLPQKFLSDAAQDLFPGQIAETELLSHNGKISKEENHYSSDPTTWLRSGPLSPQLFDKRCLDNSEIHLHSQWKNNILPSTSQPSSPVDVQRAEICQKEQFQLDRNAVKKGIFLNLSTPNGDWNQNHFRKEANFEPSQSLDSVSISFSSILSSPDAELMDAASEDLEMYISRNNEELTPTPDSSPRSTNSPSQSKNGSSTPRAAHILKPLMSPPSREEIMATLFDHDLAETIYQEPFCSNPSDAPEKPREIGGKLLTVETRLPNDLLEFEGDFSLEGLRLWKTAFLAMAQSPRPGSPLRNNQSTTDKKQRNDRKTSEDKKIVIMPCKCAPSCQQVQSWLQAKEDYEDIRKRTVIKSAEMEKAAESLNCTTLPKNLCFEIASTAENSHLPNPQGSKPVVHSEDFCFSSSSPIPPQTVDNCETNISELSRTAVKKRTVSLVTTVVETNQDVEDYVNYSSPDSLILHPWQQAASPDSKQSSSEDSEDILSSVEDNEMLMQGVQKLVKEERIRPFSVSPLLNKENDDNSEMVCLQSTPIREKICQGRIPEALGFTPLLPGPKLQKLNHRRGSNADTLRKVLLTTQNQFTALSSPKKETSQIEGPSLNNTYGFKISVQNLQEAKTLHEVQHLALLSIELHARTRRDLEADPEFDPISALFYCISSDTLLPNTDKMELTGAIVIDKDRTRTISSQGNREHAPLLTRSGISGLEVTYATDERALFQEVVNIVKRYDPDILLGYEVQMHSWGYLLQRAAALGVDLCQMISRIPDDKKENRFAPEHDEYGSDTMSEINIVGRVILNIWRIMRNEVALTNYTFENVSFHILHQRFPLFTPRVLSDWFDNKADIYRWKMVDYYISRVRGNLQLLEQVDLIGRTSEMARLFGIQFLHVLTRGSQYRVESMMLRIAKPMNYIAVTPSVQQRAQMRAPQCIPLIMEPESRFYSNAVLVLDFQSLYPSIVIAYNYCFSTCLGHIENLGKYDEFKFGCSSLRVCPDLLYQLRHDITVSPSGVAFVKPSVRKGVLPRMLEEILKTRIMVKQSMKAYKHDRAITRMLEARQLGLKLIANVTFGYTAANFSGRMPCIEIGDSIVHKARETLERAIKLVNDTKKWGARVVYGDTDSMFVLLKGATKEQSFKIGQEIAEAVTATNPKPVKLKFEKVYLPCILQTKKRYVGYMYETLDQKDPIFDAKGIETVRRDSCPAVSKILERSIKLLFETRDISQIKQYVQNQCMKLLEGKASMQDFIFAKEYRGISAYRPGSCVPALEITRRMLAHDRRSEPRVGERVPYVIVYGMPGLPLIQLVRRPIEVLQDPSLRLNAAYYITKQILPPLARILSLIGIDVFSWYRELPRIQKAATTSHNDQESRKGTISQYFTTLHCPVCNELTQHGICSKCRSQPQHVVVILNQGIRELERKHEHLVKICKNCTGCLDRQIPCVSLNCPVLFKVSRVSRELSKAPYLRQLLDQF
ncbi:DNA polymerase zeta catalytic subunit isoform X1 [Hemicordylus capensis]|uniref:DNA polymerase zeta catalytic subunit isoform X1 n=1 Tax=Hemicordylus capensis TaxID=884348 RepID=UPI002304149C|nr:DNA polymerase zeta catalytic subunit isoform X1 [Hemicordylus capensis]